MRLLQFVRLIIGFGFLAAGATMFAIPNMTRRGVLFGFAVAENFRESPTARKSIAEFRMLTAIATTAALMVLFLVPETFLAAIAVAGPAAILLAGGLAFVWAGRKVAPFAAQPVRERAAELTSTPERLPWFFWLAPGPFGILSAAAGFLYRNWEHIPVRFPVHWGVNGQPNGWEERTFHDIYGPLIFGTEMAAFMLIMGLATWFGARRSQMRRMTLAALIEAEYMIGLLFAAISIGPLVHVPTWLIVLGPLAFIAPMLIGLARALAEPSDGADPTPNECWKSGMIYYNPNDPALFVEKRAGLGYTFNFANRWSWILLLGLVVVIATTRLL
jgi:uncharacterized membrane protein